MQRETRLELLAGLVVAGLLVVMMVLAVAGRQHKHSDGYPLNATFSSVDGLDIGSDVDLAGIVVGHVTKMSIDPRTYQAQVTFTVAPDVKLPVDSAALITSTSLLGSKYIALSPGGADAMLKPGAMIAQTQGAISLEQLLSKFIFSLTSSLSSEEAALKKALAPSCGKQAQPQDGQHPAQAQVP
ncbi:outer membrane lipid asymmetry maintenance protein MlaD [Formicincola oecophyllae]|uniref:Outer membrane lipid asymmetry maintenance protein MlaD n=1 Tax=Formicincola oecophyllae TaxID=2558361 RepID=A0A4Y6UCQ7_9PROT|nr:outer membrane lipid asymmetry maintenance protein MlaD [Formicincola oecophyllae]QDH14358.1 outer membrane lipid asymmetry maintenance protein MlaD [Formicincola oecophyllae]